MCSHFNTFIAIMKSFLAMIFAFVAFGCCHASMETLNYTVEEVYNGGEFERRNYPAGRAFACTNATHYGGDTWKIFLALKRYFDGDNHDRIIIPMTVPVFTIRHLAKGIVVEDRTCIYLGQHYANNSAPTPNSPAIEIRRPSTKIAFVRQVGGSMSVSSWSMEYYSFKSRLVQNHLGDQLVHDFYGIARFNTPQAKGPRKNEVWIFKMAK